MTSTPAEPICSAQTHSVLLASSLPSKPNYTATLTHYTAQESAQKLDWVRKVLEDLKPARVLDIGANTGVFSALAAENGARVVAL